MDITGWGAFWLVIGILLSGSVFMSWYERKMVERIIVALIDALAENRINCREAEEILQTLSVIYGKNNAVLEDKTELDPGEEED